jgi:hypothetical protein
MNQRDDIAWIFLEIKGGADWLGSREDRRNLDIECDSNSGEKRKECMWIHPFVILQLFIPKFRHCGDVNFLQDNHSMFVRCFNSNDQKNYESIFGKLPRFDYLWLGQQK